MLRTVVVALIAATFLLLVPDSADAMVRSYPVAGKMMSCRDSQLASVMIGEDLRVDNVAYAHFLVRDGVYVPIITFNPKVLRSMEPRVQLFWFAHECAHHQLGHLRWFVRTGTMNPRAEAEADCLAARSLRWDHGFNQSDLEVVARWVFRLPGSAVGHLPGPQRAHHIMRCAAD